MESSCENFQKQLLFREIYVKYFEKNSIGSYITYLSRCLFSFEIIKKPMNINTSVQAFTNCVQGYDRARNVHAIGITRARKFVHVIDSSLKKYLESADLPHRP